MKRILWITIFLILQGGVILKGFDSGKRNISLGELLPQDIYGWKAKGEDAVYDPQAIFDYIDGAGEVYRSYNFKALRSRRFSKQGQPDIVADLFEMSNSKDAFGVFTHDLEGEDAGIGQGSTYKGGLLFFWKEGILI